MRPPHAEPPFASCGRSKQCSRRIPNFDAVMKLGKEGRTILAIIF
jgi:hypothetical protein